MLDFFGSICLLLIYLAMKLRESLMFLMSDARCLSDPCSKMGWKLPSHNSSSIGVLGSYSSCMLMMISLTCWISVDLRTGLLMLLCCGYALFLWLAALLTWISSLSVYSSCKLFISFLWIVSSETSLSFSILVL